MVQPDLLFVSNERAAIITADNMSRARPILVVEILSPATAERDRTIKLDLYALHGVNEYWIVDTDAKTIMVLLRGESRFRGQLASTRRGRAMRSPTLEGFSVALEEDILKMYGERENALCVALPT